MVTRRAFLKTAAALAAQEVVRYPDPRVVVLDDLFAKYRIGNTPVERLYHGTYWAEGPAWNGVGRYLVWSDIPNDVQLRCLEGDGHVTTFRHPSGNSNGNTFDYQGRQISCEHLNRRVVRYDPGYGSMGNYEGKERELLLKEAVYRIDAVSGQIALLTDEAIEPNGLCFSHDYKKLYVADSGRPDRDIKLWDVVDGHKLTSGCQFTTMEIPGVGAGGADGIRADVDGNIWSSAGWVGDGFDGVHVFAPDGTRIGQILLPEVCSNLCFGGSKRNRLFMTASQSLYAVYVETRGAHIT